MAVERRGVKAHPAHYTTTAYCYLQHTVALLSATVTGVAGVAAAGVVVTVTSPALRPQMLDLFMAPLGALSAPGMLTQS